MKNIFNVLELASEMAHRELVLQTCIEFAICEDDAEYKVTEELQENVITYKEDYQDKFNQLYDEYYERFSMLGEPVENTFVWSKDDVQRHFDCTDGEAFEVIEKLNDNDYTNETINEMIVLIGGELGLKRATGDE